MAPCGRGLALYVRSPGALVQDRDRCTQPLQHLSPDLHDTVPATDHQSSWHSCNHALPVPLHYAGWLQLLEDHSCLMHMRQASSFCCWLYMHAASLPCAACLDAFHKASLVIQASYSTIILFCWVRHDAHPAAHPPQSVCTYIYCCS